MLYTRKDLAWLRDKGGSTEKWFARLKSEYGIGSYPTEDCSLYLGHCSQTKPINKSEAIPKQFYVSERNKRFYLQCEAKKIRYGILSDLYGVHFDNESLPFYDIHPEQLPIERLHELGKIIGEKIKSAGHSSVHYVAGLPLNRTIPYLIMLFASELKFTVSIAFPKRKIGFGSIV